MDDKQMGENFGIIILFHTIMKFLATEEQTKEIYSDLKIWLEIDNPEIGAEFLDGMKEVIRDVIEFS